jgi:HD-GYP domain-containing protein (c-di-GMP phosphodiesterase class II)
MQIDTYETADAEALRELGQARYSASARARRILITEAVGAVVFLLVALALALLATSVRSLSAGALAVSVITYLVAARVTFPVGSAWTHPTQLVFVPMLFVLPTPIVPLIVAACLLVDLWPHALERDISPARVFARLGDSAYSLGPALVLVLAGDQTFSWAHWPVLVLAFAAQIVCDSGAGLAPTWHAERIPSSLQLPMVWIYLTDACLSCVGLMIAASAVRRPGLLLLALPLVGLSWLFARERHQRIEQTLSLSTAYRGTALLLGDVVEADDRYTGIHSREVVDLALAVADGFGLDAL